MDDGTDGWMESFISSRRPLLNVITPMGNCKPEWANFDKNLIP